MSKLVDSVQEILKEEFSDDMEKALEEIIQSEIDEATDVEDEASAVKEMVHEHRENLINEMIQMQYELDKAIYTAKGVNYDPARCNLAILDEVGELTHELKGEWCWWKDTQPEVDNQRVLEELVDVWHFTMSKEYHESFSLYYNRFILLEEDLKKEERENMHVWYRLIEFLKYITLNELVALTLALGFEIEDVYLEYIRKNRVNYERLKNGY